MRPDNPRRLLPRLAVAVTAVLAITVAGTATADAATRASLDGGRPALDRPASDNPAVKGATAPIGGVVPGLTGAAADDAAGEAADRFREIAAQRTARSSAAAAAAAQLHTSWGVDLPQARGQGLRATHSVLTGVGALRGGDYVYAPTALPAGGACMEMTTAYTPQGPRLWAWDWCGGNAGVGKIVNLDAAFLATYTTMVNGRPAYSTDMHKTNATNNTWTAYLYNFPAGTWDVFYTSSGVFDLPQFSFGWDMFEIYSSIETATGRGYYCTDLPGRAFETTGMQIQVNGAWTAATPANTSPIGTIPSGSQFQCPPLTFSVTHANDAWLAQIGGTTPPTSTNLARTATPSASYTSPWETVAALNDGIDPAQSNDTVNRRWGTWPNQGQQTATLTWAQAQRVSSADIYFFDDNGGVRLPASWRLQYLLNGSFVDVPGASGYPVATNRYNRATFTAVTTTQLRVVLQSNQASVGLLEVKAYA